MPIYEFECRLCGAHFERLQKLADADPTQCPECGKESIKRRLTAPAFRLAGSGWYETDFKKDGKRNLADKGDAPPTSGSDSTGSTPDTKPAAGSGDAKPAAPTSPTSAPASVPAAAPASRPSSKPSSKPDA